MKIPVSMEKELGVWNGGTGVDLQGWIEMMGNFKFAVGYSTIFWPRFVLIRDYIFMAADERDKHALSSDSSLESFEKQPGATAAGVEAVKNHLHLSDIHCNDTEGSADKLILLGKTLKEIYTVKLAWQFPDRPCIVDFYIPDDPEELWEYQITFWQRANEKRAVSPLQP